MPWQPWHCAIRFSMVTLLLSAAWAARAEAARTMASNLEACMALGLFLELGRRKLYSSLPIEERFPGAGRREVETLAEGDAELRKLARYVLAFHVLGDGLQAEAGADLVDRFHQRVVEVVLGDALHEEPVDLDAVHGEVLEVIEGRKAAAEIVQQEAHAHGAQVFDQRARALHVGDRRGLGDLEADRLRGDAVLLELRLHEVGEVRAGKRVPREVDREFGGRRVVALLGEALEVGEGALHPPAVDGAHEVVALRGRGG